MRDDNPDGDREHGRTSDGEDTPPLNSNRKSRWALLAATQAPSPSGIPAGSHDAHCGGGPLLTVAQTGIAHAQDHSVIRSEADDPAWSRLIGSMMKMHDETSVIGRT